MQTNGSAADLPELISRQGFCRRHGIAGSTAAAWAARGIGPVPVVLSARKVFYKLADVVAWERSVGLGT